jgi:ankyrin repeat protein
MEPETKKPKHEPTALHDAIVKANQSPAFFSDHNKAIFDLFHRNKDAAKIKDADGNYPLYLIFRYRAGYVHDDVCIYELVVKLLYHYPDAIFQQCWDDLSMNPLHFAAYHGDHDLILLVLGKDISLLNKLDSLRRTPLQLACSSKSLTSLKAVDTILRFSDININNIDKKGVTALSSSATEWRIISKLLQYPGVDATVTDSNGCSAFHLFLSFVDRMKYKNTKRSHVFGVVKMFMNCPGVLDLKNGNGQNILHVIVIWNNPHLLSALLSCNNELLIIKAQQEDNRGQTALHKACGMYYSNDKKELIPSLECLDMLLSNIDYIATINRQDKNGETALHHACHEENHVAVKELLKIPGIDLTIYNDYGNTALFSSICMSEDVFEGLMAAYKTSDNKAWEIKCLRLLLNHDECLILARNKRGYRLLDLARNRLEQITNGGNSISQPRRNDLITDMKKIIPELEDYMAKARWKMFQCIHKRSLVNQSTS